MRKQETCEEYAVEEKSPDRSPGKNQPGRNSARGPRGPSLLLNNDILSTVHDVSRKCVTRAARADGWWPPGRHPCPGGSVLLRQEDRFLIGGDRWVTRIGQGNLIKAISKEKTDGNGRADRVVKGTIQIMPQR